MLLANTCLPTHHYAPQLRAPQAVPLFERVVFRSSQVLWLEFIVELSGFGASQRFSDASTSTFAIPKPVRLLLFSCALVLALPKRAHSLSLYAENVRHVCICSGFFTAPRRHSHHRPRLSLFTRVELTAHICIVSVVLHPVAVPASTAYSEATVSAYGL